MPLFKSAPHPHPRNGSRLPQSPHNLALSEGQPCICTPASSLGLLGHGSHGVPYSPHQAISLPHHPLPAAPSLLLPALARASLRPHLRPPARGRCLLWATLGFPLQPPLHGCWPLPGCPHPESGLGLTQAGSETNTNCECLLRATGLSPAHASTHQILAKMRRNGFLSDHPIF